MTFHIAWTIALLLVFLGIVAWAWSGRRDQDFSEAANLPLEDDTDPQVSANNNSKIERG